MQKLYVPPSGVFKQILCMFATRMERECARKRATSQKYMKTRDFHAYSGHAGDMHGASVRLNLAHDKRLQNTLGRT